MKTSIPVTRRHPRRGSALIETALSFSAFLLLTFGVMEFSMAVFAYNFCSYAARDATRWASVRGSSIASPATNDDIKAFVKSQAVGLISNSIGVTTTWVPDNSPGSEVRVAVTYDVIPLAGLAIKNTLKVGSTAQTTVVH